jgi:hypothetical protein
MLGGLFSPRATRGSSESGVVDWPSSPSMPSSPQFSVPPAGSPDALLSPGDANSGVWLTGNSAAAARRAEKWASILRSWPPRGNPPPGAKLKSRARKGVPLALRARIWLCQASGGSDGGAGARQYEMLLAGAIPPLDGTTQVDPVLALAMKAAPTGRASEAETSPRAPVPAEVLAAVARDIARTFPRHPLFSGNTSDSDNLAAHESGSSSSGACGSSAASAGQAALARILVAYARGDPSVGYCQGLNFIAGLLLMAASGTLSLPLIPENAGDASGDGGQQRGVQDAGAFVTPEAEVAAFAMLWGVMAPARRSSAEGGGSGAADAGSAPALGGGGGSGGAARSAATDGAAESSAAHSHSGFSLVRHTQPQPPSMAVLFLPGLPRLTALLHVLSGLLTARLPKLAATLSANGVQASMWATQWLMTVFSYSLPLPAVARIWDSFLVEGWKVPLRVALALLHAHQPALLAAAKASGFEGLLLRLQEIPRLQPATDPDELLGGAFRLRSFSWRACADLLAEEEWLREQGREAEAGGACAGSFIRTIPIHDLNRLRARVAAVRPPDDEDDDEDDANES